MGWLENTAEEIKKRAIAALGEKPQEESWKKENHRGDGRMKYSQRRGGGLNPWGGQENDNKEGGGG